MPGAYEDDATTIWVFTRALWHFWHEGAGPGAKAALRAAIAQHPHVTDYLLGRKRMPMDLPPYIGSGDESEAAAYILSGYPPWLRTPGATEWICSQIAST